MRRLSPSWGMIRMAAGGSDRTTGESLRLPPFGKVIVPVGFMALICDQWTV